MSVTLPQSFYQRSTVEVAKDLIGKILVRDMDGSRLAGLIVETEAYGHGNEDAASHASRGLTDRNKVMFGREGIAYVYFTYGNHYCVNVTARNGTPAGAVLIRSIEPTEGIEIMRRLRGLEDLSALANGPGKLTQAMMIDLHQNCLDMTDSSSSLRIETAKVQAPPRQVLATPRIGISKATEKRWRFIDPASAFLSRKTKLVS